MRSKTIVIPGRPQGKARPRVTRYGTYTPESTKRYEELIRACWLQQADGWCVKEGPVGVIMMAYFPIPVGTSKANRERMLAGTLRPTKKPDCDNILKTIDALNGWAFTDDKQIVSMSVQKFYAEEPRLEVVLYDV